MIEIPHGKKKTGVTCLSCRNTFWLNREAPQICPTCNSKDLLAGWQPEEGRHEITPKATLSTNAKKLLEILPLKGMIGNRKAMEESGLKGDDYWDAKNELVEGNRAVKGTGFGGSIGRFVTEEEKKKPVSKKVVSRESELYKPLKEYYEETYKPDFDPRKGEYFYINITANNRKLGKGKWSIPDLVLVTVRKYSFIPEVSVDVNTLEVKRYRDLSDIKCVFEAASHRKLGTKTYLVYEWVDDPTEEDEDNLRKIEDEAVTFNVGLISMVRRGRGQYDIDVVREPDRALQNVEVCSEFLDTLYSKDHEERERFHRAINR